MYNIAAKIAQNIKNSLVILLEGPIAAGKTYFTRAFLKEAGVKGNLTSPSYEIVRRYESKGVIFYHIDLYRLANDKAAYQAGIADLLEEDAIFIIEWWKIAENLIISSMKPTLNIEIKVTEDNFRELEIKSSLMDLKFL